MDNIEKVIREELGKIINKDGFEIPSDANLTEEVGLDSLNVLELFGMIEDKFNVLVPPERVSDMKTINDIVGIINEFKN